MKRIEASEVQNIAPKLGFKNRILSGYEEAIADRLTSLKENLTSKCFTNRDRNVVAYKSRLPGVLSAAITTRLSRSSEPDVREVFWKDFIVNSRIGVDVMARLIADQEDMEMELAQDKAEKLIRNILDEFGDDSVREQASGYVAVKDASIVCLMEAFSHPLVTGISQSTRYIDWKEREGDHYRFRTPEAIKNSKYGDESEETKSHAFDVYRDLWDPVWAFVAKKNPIPEGVKPEIHERAIKGRVCDNLRRLLPLDIINSFALHANYRTFSELSLNLRASGIAEVRRVGTEMADELKIVNPAFMAIMGSEYAQPWMTHRIATREILERAVQNFSYGDRIASDESKVSVRVVNRNPTLDIARAIISYGRPGLNNEQLTANAQEIVDSGKLFEIVQELSAARQNRRHKVPDVFEAVAFDVQFRNVSFAALKDLMRHRVTRTRSEFDWSAQFGWYVPEDIAEMGGEVKNRYDEVQRRSIDLYHRMVPEFPYEARGILTHGTNSNWRVSLGGAEGVWIEELRSIASGDPEYRLLAQDLWRGQTAQVPLFGLITNYVDMTDYPLGRITEAVKADLKRGATRK